MCKNHLTLVNKELKEPAQALDVSLIDESFTGNSVCDEPFEPHVLVLDDEADDNFDFVADLCSKFSITPVKNRVGVLKPLEELSNTRLNYLKRKREEFVSGNFFPLCLRELRFCSFFLRSFCFGMSSRKQSGTLLAVNRPDVQPSTSRAPYRSDAVMQAGELPKAADFIKWAFAPGPRELEQTADLIPASGYCGVEEGVAAST